MDLTKINHVAVAVHSIEEAARFYTEGLGQTLSATELVAEQKVRVAFVQIGEVKIELLEPTSDDSPIARHLASRGPGLHHVCYQVPSIDAALEELKAAGVRLIDQTPRVGAHGARIAFIHPKASGGVLTEVCEPRS